MSDKTLIPLNKLRVFGGVVFSSLFATICILVFEEYKIIAGVGFIFFGFATLLFIKIFLFNKGIFLSHEGIANDTGTFPSFRFIEKEKIKAVSIGTHAFYIELKNGKMKTAAAAFFRVKREDLEEKLKEYGYNIEETDLL